MPPPRNCGRSSAIARRRLVQSVIREAGDPTTVVESRRLRAEYTPFGQTRWSLADQARFAAGPVAACRKHRRVVDLMRNLSADHRWGLAAKGFAAKGGWGPGLRRRLSGPPVRDRVRDRRCCGCGRSHEADTKQGSTWSTRWPTGSSTGLSRVLTARPHRSGAGPGSAKAARSASANSSTVVARRAGTPMPFGNLDEIHCRDAISRGDQALWGRAPSPLRPAEARAAECRRRRCCR